MLNINNYFEDRLFCHINEESLVPQILNQKIFFFFFKLILNWDTYLRGDTHHQARNYSKQR